MSNELQGEASGPQPMRAPRKVRFGLASRLLALVVLFVMLTEVAVYIPSIANFRNNWLQDRLSAAYTAALVFEVTPSTVPRELNSAILESVGARSVAVKSKDARLVLAASGPPVVPDARFDTRDPPWIEPITSAFETLMAKKPRVIAVLGPAPLGADYLEIEIEEAPLREAMWRYSFNVLLLSLTISAIVAFLAVVAIHFMVLRPVRRLTTSITEFGRNPEASEWVIEPSGRSHEIGIAEDALAVMQRDLLRELNRKKRLAALGLAVAKINHDMRNMLASAQLLSDRLVETSDPIGQRIAPKLVATLDRAISFCQSTLVYGRAVERQPKQQKLSLHSLVSDVAETVSPFAPGIEIDNAVARDFYIFADQEQLFRVLLNLVRNAVDALTNAGPQPGTSPTVRLRARKEGNNSIMEVCDNGPGVPPPARGNLFQPFSGSSRPGSTGLGLSIAADIVQGHGGHLRLVTGEGERGLGGATFRITLPRRRTKPQVAELPEEAA